MDFAFTEEQDAVGQLAEQILGDRATHERLREIERADGPRFDRDTWAALAEAGVLGIAVPEGAGGAGLGLIELARVLEVVGRTGAIVPAWETLALGALPVAQFGSDEMQAAWLPRVVDGSAVLTGAWTPPTRDRSALGVTGAADSDGHRLDGAVTCVPAGAIADAVVVPAEVGEDQALFLVPVGEEVEVTPLVTTSGSPDARLDLSGAPAQLLATGEDAVRWAYERAVALQCAVALGNAASMLDLIASYTKERKQFDVPIAMFQAVGHRAADSYIDVEGIRLTTWQAVSRLAEGLDATGEVSVAKHWAATGGHRLSLAAAHLHGGVGVDRDYPLARHFTKAKELELLLGGSTEHLLRLGALIAERAA